METTSEERMAALKRANPAAWVVWMLAKEFPDRNMHRDVRMSQLIDEVIADAVAETI